MLRVSGKNQKIFKEWYYDKKGKCEGYRGYNENYKTDR